MTTNEHNSTENKKSFYHLSSIIIVAIIILSIVAGAYFILKNKSTAAKATTAIEQQQISPQEQLQNAIAAAQNAPNIQNLINLGLAYFNNQKYIESIAINTRVLQMDSTNTIAYNNICAAYNNLSRHEEAIAFGNKALQYDTSNTLAKNNIVFAEKRIETIKALHQKIKENTEKNDVVELGLYYYTRKEFTKAINIYETGITTLGEDALLLNNLCASYCEIKEWDKAIIYGEKALKIQPDFTLAKNNLQWANDGKAGKYN
jgi:tetratricopeptide (TPR) repeat protein